MIDPNLFASGADRSGVMNEGDFEALRKALTAGYGTDMATLSGGASLRVQSLDHAMQAMIQTDEDFKLFNRLPKPHVGATVDEWTEMTNVGGFLGGSTNSELGDINPYTGTYNRRVGQVKYLMTQRQVSLVQSLQTTIADSQATEYMAGARQLLSDAEYLSFEGDSTVVPTEFDGIYAQIMQGIASGRVDTRNRIDARGGSVSSIGLVNQAAAQIRGLGQYGKPTDMFMSLMTQADFDTGLDPAFRVSLNNVGDGGLRLGAPVVGIRTSHGNIRTSNDIFIRDEQLKQPFEVLYPAVATSNSAFQPVSVTGARAANALSQFTGPQAGNYVYAVSGMTAAGQSAVVISGTVAVAGGDRVTLTITRSAGAGETGYVIYRSQQNGGNSVAGSVPLQGSDFREIGRVPVGGATTTFFDTNSIIPGSTKAFVLNLDPAFTAMTWRQMLPMIKFNLYPTTKAVIPWAQLLFGYLRITKPKQMVVIDNIVPNGAIWKPFI